MKLLIVDDEKRIRALIAKYASFEGYETDEAEDGMQAVAMCRERRYDLIIMDVMMPELDGFSAVREIRKHSDTPVIMLSACPEPGEADQRRLGIRLLRRRPHAGYAHQAAAAAAGQVRGPDHHAQRGGVSI